LELKCFKCASKPEIDVATKFTFTKENIEKLQFIEGQLSKSGKPLTNLEYWDEKESGLGVRVSQTGKKTFFFMGRLDGNSIRVNIDEQNLKQTRDRAAECRISAKKGIDPRRPKHKQGDSNFGALLTAYIELLEVQGKKSAIAVKNAIEKDVHKAHPRLWKKPVANITLDDCMAIVGAIRDTGKPRQADKVRSYIRTAFSEAINARGDINMPQSMRALNVTHNPARDMRKVKGASKARDRALSLAEFRSYWKRIQTLPEPKRSLAMLHVLTGGQRQQQLARATLSDIDQDTCSLTIHDIKGRRAEPRKHVIPLLPKAQKCIENIGGGGEFIFSSDGGIKPIGTDYLNSITKSVCSDMEKADELEKEPFTAGTIRATIESRLIAKPYRISSDVLGQLLSHGLGGIQQRHYQHHDFFDEKMEALKSLQQLLEEQVVVPLRTVG
jgi:integrase